MNNSKKYTCSICNKILKPSNNVVKIHLNNYCNNTLNKIQIEEIYIQIVFGYKKNDLLYIINEYLEGLSINEIKAKYNNCNVSNYLKLLKIKRSNSESKKTKKP